MDAIFRWANENQGVLSLFALIVSLPTLAMLIFHAAKRIWPPRHVRQLTLAQQFLHASKIKGEIEAHAEWDTVLKHYGEFLIRDASGKLPGTEESHSSLTAAYWIGVLIDIHAEHLAFIIGAMGIKFIQNIGGHWHYAREEDDGAIKVDTVFWLNYRDIVFVRWETDTYWEWPQIGCRLSGNAFPFSKVFFAEECDGLPRPYFRPVCLVSEVFKRPSVCA